MRSPIQTPRSRRSALRSCRRGCPRMRAPNGQSERSLRLGRDRSSAGPGAEPSFVGSHLPIANSARESCAALAPWSLRLYAHRGIFASTSRHLTIRARRPADANGEDTIVSDTTTARAESAVRPFRIEVSTGRDRRPAPPHQCDALADQELVTDRSQGVQSAAIHNLARYWTTEYDWRRCEARLNALPQFKTEIDGLDIHFIHVEAGTQERVAVDHDAPAGRARSSNCSRLSVHSPIRPRTAAALRTCSTSCCRRSPATGSPASHRARLGPRPYRTGVGGADAAPGLPPGYVAQGGDVVSRSPTRWAAWHSTG